MDISSIFGPLFAAIWRRARPICCGAGMCGDMSNVSERLCLLFIILVSIISSLNAEFFMAGMLRHDPRFL